MNQGKRNIVFVGFSQQEIEKLEFKDIRDQKEAWTSTDITHRFPRLLYFDTVKEAKRHQGLILFYKIEEEFDFVKYDIQNRKQFKNYEYVFLVVPKKNKIDYFYQVSNITHIKTQVSKLALISFYHLAYHPSLMHCLNQMYKIHLENIQKKFSNIKLQNIEKLKQHVKKTTYINIKKTALLLHVSNKWVERYLIDMNFLYHNVGYDKRKKMWYIVK